MTTARCWPWTGSRPRPSPATTLCACGAARARWCWCDRRILISRSGATSCAGAERTQAAMLVELRIRNFAIIEGAALYFGPGFNVLSGATGAGQTIIMTALGLLLGGRASPDMIRAGQTEAVVEGLFELEGEAPIEETAEWMAEEKPREIVVRRVIAEGGRSRVSINDNTATVQGLARLGVALVQIYGQ